jgi:L-iditol 2-dehydrogenase
MKAVVVTEVGKFEFREMEPEKPGYDEVLVKVLVTGLCRTDLKLIRAGHRDLVLPRIPGEEVVGTIVALGPGVAGLSEGQRVYIYPGKSCGICEMCRNDAENLCHNMEIMGFHRHGGFAEYVVAPAASILPIPEAISAEEAVFAEPLSCCLNALELARISNGDAIGIWGGGPAGSLLARAADSKGALPHVIDPDPARARRSGGTIAPPQTLFNACIVAVGSADAYKEALTHLQPRGRLIVFSGLAPDASRLAVDFNELHYREQTITGAYGCSLRHGAEAIAAISARTVRVKDLISHSMPLERLDEALTLVERRECMKIHLYPTH